MSSEPQKSLDLAQQARSHGDRTTSLEHFRNALAADPDQTTIKMEIASDLRELGRLDEAEAAFEQVLKQAPQHYGALLGLGHTVRRRRDHARALACFEAAALADPNQLSPRVEIASDLRELGRLDEAEAAFEQVLKQAPQHYGALLGLGHTVRRRRDHARALACFEAAALADPNQLSPRVEIASELKDRGHYVTAICLIDAVIQADPANVHAKMQRGYIHRHAGDRQAACDEFRRISETYPDFTQAFVELAIEERALGRPAVAEQILEEVLETQPRHLSALTQLAESARLSGDIERCLSIYQHAIELYPKDIWLYIHTTQALNECGERAAALDLLETATSLFGERCEIICKRVELLKQAGHLPAARHLAQAALRDNPYNFPLWSHCVQFDLLLGDFEAAAAKLQVFSSESISERSRVRLFYGQLAEAQYKLEEAREHYRAALMLNPQDGWAQGEMFRICMLLLRVDEAGSHLKAWNQLNIPTLVARRQSTNSSQSHMGQVHGEFAMNRKLIDHLAEIRALPPRDRISPLQALLRRNADHTASAVQLIVALHEAQLLNFSQPESDWVGCAHIPKVVIQYWNDLTPPEDVKLLMESWRSTNTDYRHRVFDDVAAQEFLERTYAPNVLRAYRRADNPAEKADLFRLAYLYAHGGVYVDADDRCLAPISSVLPPHVALAVYQEDYALGGLAIGTLGNNFLAAAPNNAVIGRALELATDALNRGDTDMVWLKTGPALITRAFAEIASKTPLTLSAWLKNVAVLKRSELLQFSAIHCFVVYKKTNRHWTNTVVPTRGARVQGENRSAHASDRLRLSPHSPHSPPVAA